LISPKIVPNRARSQPTPSLRYPWSLENEKSQQWPP